MGHTSQRLAAWKVTSPRRAFLGSSAGVVDHYGVLSQIAVTLPVLGSSSQRPTCGDRLRISISSKPSFPIEPRADCTGVAAVCLTYPMELVRVRMAYQTGSRPSLRHAIGTIFAESRATQQAAAAAGASQSQVSAFTRSFPLYPFYRGFSITLLGMIPYAGVSFLTYGTLKRHLPHYLPYLETHPTTRDLSCGAIAGLVSQTASYPFEVVRRRMQVASEKNGVGVNWRQAVHVIYEARGWRGFFVGLSIGYIKVIPMTSISFATWQFLKRVLDL
jgi:solute carrier family 25 protein 16